MTTEKNFVQRMKEKISNVSQGVKDKAKEKMYLDMKAGKKSPALIMARKMVLIEFEGMAKNDYPQYKGKKFDHVIFMGKKQKDGTDKGRMGTKCVSEEIQWVDLDDNAIKRLKAVSPTKDEGKTDEILIKFDFLNSIISGSIKMIGSNITETFNW